MLWTSELPATLAYPATIWVERVARAGPITGHFVARSVNNEIEGYLGEVEVHKVRRVDCLVLPKKGQEALKRDKEDSLSIGMKVRVVKEIVVRETLWAANRVRL